MLRLLYIVTMVYLPASYPFSVEIDGSVKFVQNWKFRNTNSHIFSERKSHHHRAEIVTQRSREHHRNHKKGEHVLRHRSTSSSEEKFELRDALRTEKTEKFRVGTTEAISAETEPILANKLTDLALSYNVQWNKTRVRKPPKEPAELTSVPTTTLTTMSSTDKHPKVELKLDGNHSSSRMPPKEPALSESKLAGVKKMSALKTTSKKHKLRTKSMTTTTTTTTTRTTTTTTEQNRITLYYLKPKQTNYWGRNDIYKQAIYVKDDPHIKNFTEHIFKQSMDVFDGLKQKMNSSKLRSKVEYLSKSYKQKFRDFVNKTQNQKILTRLGNQKVILNTIETSKRFMNRLLNYLISDMWTKGVLRQNDPLENILRSELQNEEQQEYIHACQKFNICRSRQTYSSFLADILTIFLQVDDRQLKQGMDALTETVKNTNFNHIMDKRMRTKFQDVISNLETSETTTLRPLIWMFRNTILNRNQPLVIPEQTPMEVVNQTVGLIDVIDILDQKIQPTEANVLQWTDIKTGVIQWANRERKDIQEIMQAFVGQFVSKGIKKMNTEAIQNLHDKLKVVIM